MRIYRNCSNPNEYEEQADIIINRFVEKGYNKKELTILKEKVKTMDRKMLIEGKLDHHKKEKNKNLDMAFLPGYNRQYKTMESILEKHWPILQSDKILNSVLPKRPIFIYRKAPSLRNKLVHNALDPPKQIKVVKNLKGFYKCGKCLPCRVSKRTNKKISKFTIGQHLMERNITLRN